MKGEMNPILYYKLDGTQYITAPFAGGGQQFKDAADGVDPTDLTTGQFTGTIVVATNDPVTNYATIDVTLDIITSIEDVAANDAVLVYPNPTTNMVFVQANGIIKEVRVSNYLGQLVEVFNFVTDKASINVSDYDNGVYFIEVTTISGKHTVKVIKE
jgi:hypothetical protein